MCCAGCQESPFVFSQVCSCSLHQPRPVLLILGETIEVRFIKLSLIYPLLACLLAGPVLLQVNIEEDLHIEAVDPFTKG